MVSSSASSSTCSKRALTVRVSASMRSSLAAPADAATGGVGSAAPTIVAPDATTNAATVRRMAEAMFMAGSGSWCGHGRGSDLNASRINPTVAAAR
jgi:hypothetical protein